MKIFQVFCALIFLSIILLISSCGNDCDPVEVGDQTEGGIVFFVEGCNGKVVSLSDIPGKLTWATAENRCDVFVNDGYSDWYLPTPLELMQISDNLNSQVSFSEGNYWSSEDDSNFIFPNSRVAYDIVNGNQYSNHRDSLNFARAVRDF